MADSQHSSSGKTYVHSPEEETSEESKLKFSEDEETLIIRMYNLVGERWALIAGRIPGRTAEEIEEYWNTRYSTSE
ncbi:CAPRICE [Hibiscus trionum]|uniref:CAPRICE n=1 Tax=Hibiscus trionum TaxID=183268 RepID=A0A9W7JIT8_HIBTR|nr:CAPRICE [Hibiscus trionum]